MIQSESSQSLLLLVTNTVIKMWRPSRDLPQILTFTLYLLCEAKSGNKSVLCISGVRCWPVDLDVSVLDQQLKLFVSRHSAFLSEEVRGERKTRHNSSHVQTLYSVQSLRPYTETVDSKNSL